MTQRSTHSTRRDALRMIALAGTATAAPALWSQDTSPTAAPLTIAIVAQRFTFKPSEITVPAGRPIVLELRTLDFEHGFSLPQLKLRADFVPDRTVRLEIPPQRAGSYAFLCDNFCGEDHEDMHGRLVVQDPA